MRIHLRKSFSLLLLLLDNTDRVCAGQDAVEHDHYRRVEDLHCRAVHSQEHNNCKLQDLCNYHCPHTQIGQKRQSQGTQGHAAGDHNDAFLEAESVIKEAPDNSAQLKKID